LQWQAEQDPGPAPGAILDPHPTLARGENTPHDRRAQAVAIFAGRIEGIEQVRQLLIQPSTAAAHDQQVERQQRSVRQEDQACDR